MRSMTGYSKLTYQDESFAINMELKSVNNKNLNLKIKLPYNLNFFRRSNKNGSCFKNQQRLFRSKNRI